MELRCSSEAKPLPWRNEFSFGVSFPMGVGFMFHLIT